MENSLLSVLLLDSSLLAFLIGYILGITLMGHKKRSYCYLGISEKINGYDIEQFAAKFKPIIYQKDDYAPFPFKIVYEIIDHPNRYIIIYHIFWENEIFHKPLMHYLYTFFRILYYGSIQDIEFLEVTINKEDHSIEEFHFETVSEKSKHKVHSHEYVLLVKSQKKFIYKTENYTKQIDFSFIENQQIQLQVISWNHLLMVSKTLEGKKYDLPLSYLDDKQFRKYKMCRRSSGEISTRYSGLVNQFATSAIALLIGFLPLLIYFLIKL